MFFLAFAAAAILISMAPGPSTVVILRQTVKSGRRAGIAAMAGNEAGVMLWGIGAAFGLSALLLASRVAYDTTRIAGAVVLVTLGARMLWQTRRRGHAQQVPDDGPPAEPGSVWRAFRLGLLTNVANPKAGVFAVSFLPQFVPHGAPVLPMLVAFSLIWVLIDTVWYLSLIWVTGRARRVFQRPAVVRRMERVSGTVLVGIGVGLAVEAR